MLSGQLHASAVLFPANKHLPLCRTIVGPQSWSWSLRKRENLLPLQEFDPRTVQPVWSRHTNYAIPSPVNEPTGVVSDCSLMNTLTFRKYFSIYLLNYCIPIYMKAVRKACILNMSKNRRWNGGDLWLRRSHSTQAQSTASHCRLTSPSGEWLFTDAQ